MTIQSSAALFVAVFAVSAAAVRVVTSFVRRRGIIDTPNDRSSHTAPTPRGGGIAIVSVTVATFSVVQGVRPFCTAVELATLLLCGGAIAGVSWVDDMRGGVRTTIRFAVHLTAAAATVAIARGLNVIWLPGFDVVHAGVAGAMLAVLWIAGLTNAYNFMDGIDGIAGLQAVVAGIGWFALSIFVEMPLGRIAGVTLAAAAAGFLLHNWQPARIFMGDVGSAFLGYIFAAVTLLGTVSHPRLAVAGVLLVWPFVFDTAFTMARRARRGERLSQAHRSHIYQRLTRTGVSHRAVSGIYGLLAALGVLAAVAVVTDVRPGLALAAIASAAVALLVAVHLRERRFNSLPLERAR